MMLVLEFAERKLLKLKKDALKNAIKAVAFILILFFILRSISYVLRTNGDSKARFAGFYAEENNSIDVMMFGASTVGTSICSPYMWGKYGFTSYPLSSNTQRPKAIKYLIEEAAKYQNPQLIVVEVRTFIADDDDLASDEGHVREVVDNMRYSWHRVETINALTEKFDDKMPFYIDIMKYHSNIGMLLMPSEWKKFDYKHKDVLKGFELKNGVMAYRKDGENRPSGIYCYDASPIPEEQEVVLRDLLEYLKVNNYQALFVSTPRDHEDSFEGNMCYIKGIVNEYDYELIDTNEVFEEVNFDYRFDMDDGAHTNVWGAVKVSDYLGKYISDNYLTNIEHNSNVISEWNDSYETFMKMYENTVAEEK